MNRNSTHYERLRAIVESFPNITVAVLADLVADEFIYGEISRVSREAPVLILKHRERVVVPGGGGNAVMNLADLRVNVLPVGVVGDDETGRLILQALRARKVPLSGIVRLKGHTTPTKSRILAGMPHGSRQQVVRVDRDSEPLSETHPELLNLVSSAREYAKAADALLISDYGYGAATPRLLTFIRSKGALDHVPVTLDSRFRVLEYIGVTAATPNEHEVEAALNTRLGGDSQRLCAAGHDLMRRMKLESLVITCGSSGMMAFDGSKKPVPIPIHGSDQVTDVTGAGDTVIATFTAALAAGADTESAARLANYAGGIVVMKRGTATVSQAELLDALKENGKAAHAKQ
jgi:rfaE bifunctional protein kinase chain/domain